MMQEPQRDQSLVAHAFQTLRSAIIRVQLAPGSRLRLDTLQKEHGLSSSPLREALNRLVTEGLVIVDERRGFAVSPISISELLDLTRLRLLLEGEALRSSIETGDDAWEGGVVAAFHRLRLVEERLGDQPTTLSDDWSARHREFHLALLAGCGSERLMQLCGNLFDQAERYRRLSARIRKLPRKKSAEHNHIMDLALKRDADGAVELLRTHVQQTADNVVGALEKHLINGMEFELKN